MDREKYQFDDTYNEHNPGDEIEGTCRECGTSNQVRILSSIDRLANEQILIGPFDKKCAYSLKFGDIPPYHTLPKTNLEFLYRFITRKELPDDRDRVKRSLLRISIVGFLSLLLITIFGIGLSLAFSFIVSQIGGLFHPIFTNIFVLAFLYFLFIPFSVSINSMIKQRKIAEFNPDKNEWFSYIFYEISWSIFFKNLVKLVLYYTSWMILFGTLSLMFLVVIGMFVGALLALFLLVGIFAIPFYSLLIFLPVIYYKQTFRICRYGIVLIKNIFSGNIIGEDHLQNFEFFWDGKIHYEDRDRSYYRKISLFILITTIIYLLLPFIFPQLDVFTWMIEFWEVDFDIYYEIISLMSLDPRLTGQYLFLSIFWMITLISVVSARGKFVRFYQLPKDIHYSLLNSYEQEETDQEESSSSIQQFLKTIRGQGDATRKLYCPICKNTMIKHEVLSHCPHCAAVYHEDHLYQYLNIKEENKENKTCMVCKRDMQISFEIED